MVVDFIKFKAAVQTPLTVICPLSSRQAKYLKQSADERSHRFVWSFSMHSIALYISQFSYWQELDIVEFSQIVTLHSLLPMVFYNDIYPVAVRLNKIVCNHLLHALKKLHS